LKIFALLLQIFTCAGIKFENKNIFEVAEKFFRDKISKNLK